MASNNEELELLFSGLVNELKASETALKQLSKDVENAIDDGAKRGFERMLAREQAIHNTKLKQADQIKKLQKIDPNSSEAAQRKSNQTDQRAQKQADDRRRADENNQNSANRRIAANRIAVDQKLAAQRSGIQARSNASSQLAEVKHQQKLIEIETRAANRRDSGAGSRSGGGLARSVRAVFSPSQTALGTRGGAARDIGNLTNVFGSSGLTSELSATATGFAVAGAAVAKMTATYTDYINKVRVVSAQTGVAAQEAAKFVSVFDDLGINSDRAAAALFQFTKYLDEDRVKKYGIEVARLANGNVNVIETFLNLSKRINQTNDAAERANITYAALGRIGATVLPVLELGPDVLKKRFNQVPTVNDDDLKKQRDLKLEVAALREQFIGLSIDVGRVVVPALTKATGVVTGFSNAIGGVFSIGSKDRSKSFDAALALDNFGAKLPFVSGIYVKRIKEIENLKTTEERTIDKLVQSQINGKASLRVDRSSALVGAGSINDSRREKLLSQTATKEDFNRDQSAFKILAERDLPKAGVRLKELQENLKDNGFAQREINRLTEKYVDILADAAIKLTEAKANFISIQNALSDSDFGFIDKSLSAFQKRADSRNGELFFNPDDVTKVLGAADVIQNAQLDVLTITDSITKATLSKNQAEAEYARLIDRSTENQVKGLQALSRVDQGTLSGLSRSREDVDYQRALLTSKRNITDAERSYTFALEDQGTAARSLRSAERDLAFAIEDKGTAQRALNAALREQETVNRENSPEAQARKIALANRELRDSIWELTDAETDNTRAKEDAHLLDRSLVRATQDRFEVTESLRRSEYDSVKSVADAEKTLTDALRDQNAVLGERQSLLGNGRFETLEEINKAVSVIDTQTQAATLKQNQEALRRAQYDLDKFRRLDSKRSIQDADQSIIGANRSRQDGLLNLSRNDTRIGEKRGDLAQQRIDTAQTIKDIPIDAALAIEEQTLNVRTTRRGIEQEVLDIEEKQNAARLARRGVDLELLDIEEKKRAVGDSRYANEVLIEQAQIRTITRRIEDRGIQIEELERKQTEKQLLEDLTKAEKNRTVAIKDQKREVALLNAQLDIAGRRAKGESLSSTEINDILRQAEASALGGQVGTSAQIINNVGSKTLASVTDAIASKNGGTGTFGRPPNFIDGLIESASKFTDQTILQMQTALAAFAVKNKAIEIALSFVGKDKASQAVVSALNSAAGPDAGIPSALPRRWKGGPMSAGEYATVSEAGPELFRTRSGRLLDLGAGPNIFQAPEDGQVLTALQSAKLLAALRNGGTSYNSSASSSSVISNSNNKSVTVKVEAPNASARKIGRDVGREIVRSIRNL